MFLQLAIILYALGSSGSMPARNTNGAKCFFGGTQFRQINSTGTMSEICSRDDISMVKSIGVHRLSEDNQVMETSLTFYRLFYVKDWYECNPILDHMGTFMVLDISETGLLVPKTYTCRATCDINIDKDAGSVLLTSNSLNHYSIEGTTIKTGWFKTQAQVALENTCENIHVTCGHKTINLHACFRQHKSCIRYFRGSILPELMIESICTNMELILLVCFLIISSIVAAILTRTYLVYLLIPIFYIPVKIYGLLYDRACRKCKNCLLAVHPFSNCPTTCICGMSYNSTEALRVHRQCMNCTGYKTLTKTRVLCKKRIPNVILASLVTILFFSFITPISAQCYNYSSLPDDFKNAIDMSHKCNMEHLIILGMLVSSILAFFLVLLITKVYIRYYYIFCSYCGMIHSKRGMILQGNFTSRYLTCICSNKMLHRSTKNCIISIRYKSAKITNIIFAVVIILAMSVPAMMSCLDGEDVSSIESASLCIGVYQNISRAKEYSTLNSELSEKISNHEVTALMPEQQPTFDSLINKASTLKDLHTATLFEYLAVSLYPLQMSKHLDPAGPNSIQWRAFLQVNSPHICNEHITKMICRCVLKQEECKSTTSDHAQEIENYYKKNKLFYKADMSVLYSTIGKAFPGLTGNLLNQILENEKYEDSFFVIDKLLLYTEKNNQLTGILKFIKHINAKNITGELKKFEPRSDFRVTGSKYDTKTSGVPGIRRCETPLIVSCTGKRFRNILKIFISCSSKLYKQTNLPLVYFDRKLCIGDRYCDIEFEPQIVDSNIQHLKCFASPPTDNSNGMNQETKSIKIAQLGECKVNNFPSKIVKSASGKYYPYTTLVHKQEETIDEYCFSHDCQRALYPRHESKLTECNWDSSEHRVVDPRVMVHNDIESFISSIKLSLHNDLVTHHFKPLQNMPHIKPNFKSITLQGTISSGKVQDSYIVFNVPLITGVSQGYTVTAPDGKPLFDTVVYIRLAQVKASYAKEYTTGPTIAINIHHNEKCTGNCPEIIPKKGETWLSFSKEHTSAWGCEEWGCLAVGTGCVYGSCQDVIRPEATVYKKSNQEQPDVELCVTDPTGTLCNKIDALEPIIGEHFQVELTTVQTNFLPDVILEKNKNIYVGSINRKGTFSQGCGSVQQFGGDTYGVGNPKFDYVCHAMSRKDIVVRKCYENHYFACKTLELRQDLKFQKTKDNQHLTNDNIMLGSAKVRMILGDIQFSQMQPSRAQLSGHAICGGCQDCFNDVVCKVTLTAESSYRCKIASNCISYIENVQVTEGTGDISLKFKCSTNVITLDLCSIPINVKSEIIKTSQKLDLTSADQSSYIKEFDNKCNTWLCRAYNEGISFILQPIWGEFTIWGKYLLIVAIILILILIFAKVLKPLAFAIITLLKRNDEIYRLENKIK
ncbi:M polyprotein [Sabo virus]|uniref:Envelopment polyprotein n=1 Tax=Sabo virus TaxID=159138 RepID=J4F056_9VIRU|nr:M polyprotein [Sabo virus]CCG93480.1 M polyprotein [Sabo virus]